MPKVKVVLRGNQELSADPFTIPQSWIGKDGILQSPDYNISLRTLGDVKIKIGKQNYWSKNKMRKTVEKFDFDDRWIEKEWFRTGCKNGKYGEYWNPSKLEKLQQEIEEKIIVPDDFISMKELKKIFGSWATREEVEEAGVNVLYGRKKGKRGSFGYFVSPDILEDDHSASQIEGVIPVRSIFAAFPKISPADIPKIVRENEESNNKRKLRMMDKTVCREDLMVSLEALESIESTSQNPVKTLRSRCVTTIDVPRCSKNLRKMLRKKNAQS